MGIPERSPGRRNVHTSEATYALGLRTLAHLEYILLKHKRKSWQYVMKMYRNYCSESSGL